MKLYEYGTTYQPGTEAEIEKLMTALHEAGSMLVIEEALARATGPGGKWPQNTHGDFPNAAFSLAAARLLVRSEIQANACLGYSGFKLAPLESK